MLADHHQQPAEQARASASRAFVWHTDGVREYAYDRDTHVGRLNAGLDLAPRHGWTLINMKSDWKVIFPFELAKQ